MRKKTDTVAEWLDASSRQDLATSILSSRDPLSLPQARQLATRLNELAPASHEFRVGFVHTYTSHLLDPWLAFESALCGLDCRPYHAPYGQLLQEAEPGSDLVKHQPDVTVFLLQREDLHPDLRQPIAGFDRDQQAKLQDESIDRLLSIVRRFRSHVPGLLVMTLLPRISGPGLGLFDGQAENSESAWWATLKSRLAAQLREHVKSSLFLDLDETMAEHGRERFFDLRYWFSAAFPFSPEAARKVARQIVSLATVSKYPKAKVIALDADNTLWGGIIGEDGMNGIALGPEYPGNAFVAFQRRLLEFQQRGFILVLCSKNNPADLDEVLQKHPHQVLRSEHFAARRVNWEPKPRNLVALAEELNLGLNSFVFVDDSDHECAVVRHELPQIEVVQTPQSPIAVPSCLDRVARLEILSLTAEDRAKTTMYVQERLRRELLQSVNPDGGNVVDYLRSLQMRMRVCFDEPKQLARLSQLTLKTNQFNLTTRRYDERQVQDFLESPDWLVAHFSLADVFGDSGVVGLAIAHRTSPVRAELDTFLMSCRVIGRGAETAFLEAVLARLKSDGIEEVVAEFLPTSKNALVKDFLPSHGFTMDPDGRFLRSLSDASGGDTANASIAVEVVAADSPGLDQRQ